MGHGVRRWLVPLVVAVVAAVVGSGSVILFVDTGTAAGASIVLEPATSLGADPFTRSVTIGEVAQFPTTIHPVTRTVTAGLDPDPTTGGLTAAGDAPGLYGGTGDEHVCNPTRLADYLTHTPAKAAAWAAVLGITVHQIPDYVAELTPVVLTTDTRVTNHGFTNGGANPRPAVLQAGTAVLVDTHGIPRVKCGCGNPLTEPEARPLGETTGTPWTGYQPDHVTTITPTPRPQDTFTLTNITTGTTYTQPAGTSGGTVELADRWVGGQDPFPDGTSSTLAATYPKIVGGVPSAIARTVNAHLRDLVLQTLGDPTSVQDLDHPPPAPPDDGSAFSTVTYTKLFESSRYLTIVFSSEQYGGGAHGANGVVPANIDLRSGDLLTPERGLFRPGADVAGLGAGLESQVRQQCGSEEGFDSPSDALRQGDAEFFLAADGLEIDFDEYAVGSFACGIVTTHVPYTQAAPLLDTTLLQGLGLDASGRPTAATGAGR